MCGIQIAVKCYAGAHLPTANPLTFLHSLEAKESSGPLKAMNFACVRVRVHVCRVLNKWRCAALRFAWSHTAAASRSLKHVARCRYIRPKSTSSVNTHSWLFYSHPSLGLFSLSSLKHSAADSKMLFVFALCHLFRSNLKTFRLWWWKTADTVIWILATSCPQSLLLSSQELFFVFSSSVWQRNIRKRRTVYWGTWSYMFKPIIKFRPINHLT